MAEVTTQHCQWPEPNREVISAGHEQDVLGLYPKPQTMQPARGAGCLRDEGTACAQRVIFKRQPPASRSFRRAGGCLTEACSSAWWRWRRGPTAHAVGTWRQAGVSLGDTVRLQATDGHRATADLPVVAIVRPYLAASAYIEFETLNRLLREPGRVTAAHLLLDRRQRDAFSARVKELPRIVSVSYLDNARVP